MNLKKFQFCQKTFREKSLVAKYSQGSSESFCMKMWLFNFPQANFSGSFKSWATCENASEPVFEQKLKTQKYQNHFQKLIKHSKIFLGLIDKKLSIHIKFEHVKLHKWNKHYMNKVLCIVWEYQMWNSP